MGVFIRDRAQPNISISLSSQIVGIKIGNSHLKTMETSSSLVRAVSACKCHIATGTATDIMCLHTGYSSC